MKLDKGISVGKMSDKFGATDMKK